MTESNASALFKALILAMLMFLPLYDFYLLTPLFSDFMTRSLEEDSIKAARHISKMLNPDHSPFLSAESITPAFAEEVNSFLPDFEIKELSIFSPTGEVLYSSEPSRTGQYYPKADFWQEIRAGKTYSKAVEKDTASKDGRIFNASMIETYIPLMRGESLLGAIEIYTDVSRKHTALKGIALKIHLLVLSALLLMGATFIIASEKDRKNRDDRNRNIKLLVKAKEEWERTFDAMIDIVTILDDNFNIIQANKTSSEILETAKEKLLGQKCYQLFGGREEICPACPVEEAITDGRPHTCEITHPNLGKTFLVSASPYIDSYGRINGVVHVARDITVQKAIERQMVQNQKMASLAVLTNGIAHNFRNVLARILMNSQVLQGNYPDDPQLQEITSWINDSVQAGSRLVKGLIEFSRRKIKSEFQPIDLAELLTNAHNLMRSSIPKNINLACETGNPVEVMGDYGSLLQVITNICTNSADAMPEGGDLHISLEAHDEQALITVSDNGLGIDEALIDKIFEPFFTTKEVDKGIGMGLSSSYGIIKEHGGEIKVKSAPGAGTSFAISLPMIEKGEGDKLISLQDIEAEGQKILIIDDEESVMTPMARLLGKTGYHTRMATCCEDALTEADSWQPDLVLIDYSMPVMNGLECAMEINALHPSIKIIILSGSALEELGVNLHDPKYSFISSSLTKPIGIQVLGEAVAAALGRKPAEGDST